MFRFTRIAVVVAATGSVCLLIASPADASFPGGNGKIAFSNFDANQVSQVFTVNPDGSGRTQLTQNQFDAVDPAWSPDGRRIAYTSGGSIFVMNADGSGQGSLTGPGNSDLYPAWSPDGTKIAFVRLPDCAPGNCQEADIYVMNADGSGVNRVTNGNGLPESHLDWSPDGTMIAFSGMTGGLPHVYTVKPDGSGETRLTDVSTMDEGPSWSPDGRKIAFHSYRDAGPPSSCGFGCDGEIYLMNPDGSGQTRITNEPQVNSFPAFSPDGTRLALMRWQCAGFTNCVGGLHTMNEDGSGITRVTSEWQDGPPDWQAVPFDGYARPKGASPLRVPLVTAFLQCQAPDRVPPDGTPNRTHGPPLVFPSCNPPVTVSPAKVGTPDTGTGPANSVGVLRYSVTRGVPGGVDDADVDIVLDVTDVRCRPPGAGLYLPCGAPNRGGEPEDYAGELRAAVSLRITDGDNGSPGAATVSDTSFSVTAPCSDTTSTLIGASCTVATSADAVIPGAIKEGQRAVWGLGQVRVFDGGPDGDTDTLTGDAVFLRQGIFLP
jgi:WD40-like Beta Propeller Repeat